MIGGEAKRATRPRKLVTPKIELAIWLINASSGRDATSVMASSERGENIGITAPFENVSERNITLHVLNTKDETRNKTPDKVSEFMVPDTHFDRQSHTHHNMPFSKKQQTKEPWNVFEEKVTKK